MRCWKTASQQPRRARAQHPQLPGETGRTVASPTRTLTSLHELQHNTSLNNIREHRTKHPPQVMAAWASESREPRPKRTSSEPTTRKLERREEAASRTPASQPSNPESGWQHSGYARKAFKNVTTFATWPNTSAFEGQQREGSHNARPLDQGRTANSGLPAGVDASQRTGIWQLPCAHSTLGEGRMRARNPEGDGLEARPR